MELINVYLHLELVHLKYLCDYADTTPGYVWKANTFKDYIQIKVYS